MVSKQFGELSRITALAFSARISSDNSACFHKYSLRGKVETIKWIFSSTTFSADVFNCLLYNTFPRPALNFMHSWTLLYPLKYYRTKEEFLISSQCSLSLFYSVCLQCWSCAKYCPNLNLSDASYSFFSPLSSTQNLSALFPLNFLFESALCFSQHFKWSVQMLYFLILTKQKLKSDVFSQQDQIVELSVISMEDSSWKTKKHIGLLLLYLIANSSLGDSTG